jgi:phosphomannomutase
MVDDLAVAAGGGWRVHRTAVGEANVVAGMMAERAVIGGEGNGGVIDPRVGWIRDSLVAMGLTLELMSREGRTLSAIVNAIPRYEMIKTKQTCARSVVSAALARLPAAFKDARVSMLDGVRMDWPEGWMHVRASNTEPIMRLIGEARDRATAEQLAARVRRVLEAG